MRFGVGCDKLPYGMVVSQMYCNDHLHSCNGNVYTEEDLVKIIRYVLLENLGLKDVDRALRFEQDIKMDEPTRVEILLAIEHALGVKVENNLLASVNSINDAIELYRKMLPSVLVDDENSRGLEGVSYCSTS